MQNIENYEYLEEAEKDEDEYWKQQEWEKIQEHKYWTDKEDQWEKERLAEELRNEQYYINMYQEQEQAEAEYEAQIEAESKAQFEAEAKAQAEYEAKAQAEYEDQVEAEFEAHVEALVEAQVQAQVANELLIANVENMPLRRQRRQGAF